MNRRISRINDTPDPLPGVLHDVLDGEVEQHHPRARAALGDPSAARAFRATERIVRQLERAPRAPDLSDAILARVGEQRPFRRRRRWLTSVRLASGSGVALGVVLGIALALSRPVPQPPASARVASVNGVPAAAPARVAVASSEAIAAALAPLPLGNAARYEAVFEPPRLVAMGPSGEDDACGLCPVGPSAWASAVDSPRVLAASMDADDGACPKPPELDQRGLPVDVVAWLKWKVSS